MDLSDVIRNIHRCRIFLSSAFTFARRVVIRSIDSNYGKYANPSATLTSTCDRMESAYVRIWASRAR